MTSQKIGVVTRIFPDFAVVRAVGVRDGSVTFSNAAWQGSRPVQHRAVVVLGDLDFLSKGWRAGTVRPITEDEITPELRAKIAELG